MANTFSNATPISALPTAANVVSTDRIVVLFNAISNTSVANGSPSARTISTTNFVSSIIKGPFANDSLASSNGVILNNLYYDSTGTVKIRLI